MTQTNTEIAGSARFFSSLLGVSLMLTRFMGSQLMGASATDPVTLGGVALLLIVVAMAACFIPAQRAMRVDPTVALRYE